MIDGFSFWGAWAVGVILMLMACLGIRGFLPRALYGERRDIRVFGTALVLGFAAVGMNALYWQVFTNLAVYHEWMEIRQVRRIGGFLDIFLKGMSAVAIYLHLAAWHMGLPPEEKARWSVLGMAFYPRDTGFLARMLNSFRRKKP